MNVDQLGLVELCAFELLTGLVEQETLIITDDQKDNFVQIYHQLLSNSVLIPRQRFEKRYVRS